MAAPTTTIKAVFQAIEDALRAHFGAAIEQYGVYQPWDPVEGAAEPVLKTPALLISLDAMPIDEADTHAPGRIGIRCAISIHAILSILTEDLQIALPELAAAVTALVRQTELDPLAPPLNGNRWGLGDAISPPEAVSAEPAEFTPGLNGRDSWTVSWEQVVYLPETLPTD